MITEDYLNELAEDCVEGYDDILVSINDDVCNVRCVTTEDAVDIFKDGFRAALRQVQSESLTNKE